MGHPRLIRFTFIASIAALFAIASSSTAMAGTPTKLRAKAKTSVNVTKLKDGGAKFSGKMRIKKVTPAVGGGKVPKKMKKGAKSACLKLYSKGGTKRYEPWVKVNQDPRPGLTLNLYAGAVFKKSGKWKTSGLHPKNSHSPFTGQKLRIYGGFYTKDHNHRRDFMSASFKFKGKKREVYCESFSATYKP